MKKSLLILLTLCIPVLIHAQLSRSLEQCTILEQLNNYNDYEAVIIEDLGKIHFQRSDEGGLEYSYTHMRQMKINTASGIEWSEIEIPIYAESHQGESLEEVKVRVLNPGESVKEYKEKELDIYKEEYGKNRYYQKFAIPGVKEGSFVEVSYTTYSPYLFNLEDWVFQHSIPVLHSRLEVTVVPFYEYALLKRGSHKLDNYSAIDLPYEKNFGGAKYKERLYTFTMLNLPAFDDESYITSRNDYIDRLEFQLRTVTNVYGHKTEYMTDWASVNTDLLGEKNFGAYLSAASKHAKSAVKGLKNLEGDVESKADMVTEMVQGMISWNGYNRLFANEKPKKVVEMGKGSSAEINLYLVGALQAAGLEAYPVMLSTRSHGRVYKDMPIYRSFNYVVAAVPFEGGYILRDATDGNYPMASLPLRCLNGEGLLADKGREVWVPLSGGMDQSEIVFQLSLSPDLEQDSLFQELSIRSTGYDAIGMKKRIKDDEEELKEWLDSEWLGELKEVNFESELERTDSMALSLSAPVSMEAMSGIVFLTPFAGLAPEECPLTKKSRSYPVDLIYKQKRRYQSEITVPEGYAVSNVPQRYSLENKLVSVEYLPMMKDGVLYLDAGIEFKKRIYHPGEYRELRYFWEDIIKKMNEKIILQKAKP